VKRALSVMALLYPFAVVVALRWIEPRWIALALGTMLGLRIATFRGSATASLRAAALALLAAGALVVTWTSNDDVALLLAPVAINATLLVAFASTLFGGPTFVETIARSRVPELPPEEVQYCRTVTIVWCGFFVANGACCATLALYASRWTWATYTGFVSYALMGLLFAVEYTLRSKRFGRYRGSPIEPLLRLAFGPPRA
jgi:uncharacterized membrane protein